VASLGDPKGATVVFHHGTPGCVETMTMLAPLAASGEFFLVSASRAGYGRSTRHEGRRVASVVADTTTMLDALGRESYLSVGWSGGGPHALACGALDASRCRGVWALASVAPVDVDFDWSEGMGPENVAEFELARAGGAAYERAIRETAATFLGADADNVVELFGGLLSEVDRRALTAQDRRDAFARSCRAAFAHGHEGYLDDDHAFMGPWGFGVDEVAVPTEVWYAKDDLMVPASHGAWLSVNLPASRERYFRDDGHVSLVVEHLEELGQSWRTFLDATPTSA
ncbi:MAG: alpha/beta fold hydrolase, partial [Acidobacteriota bacterium]|nr:alpha/beta fold hydrolase [Acidobacteriota bacterium]